MLKVKALFLLLFLLVISACSRVQLAYNQLDWLIPYYVNGYIELDEQQDYDLQQQVSSLLDWHCSEQLPSYAELLKNANRNFQSGSLTTGQLQQYEARISRYWQEIMQQASPALVQLFHDMSDEQVNDLRERFAADNRNWYEAFRQMSMEEIQDENLEIMQNELERWFDDLNAAQQKQVYQWSRQFETLGYEGQRAREAWQKKLLTALEARRDKEVLRKGVELLFVHPEKLRSEKYLELTQKNKKVTLQLIYHLSRSLEQQQLKNLDGMMLTVSRDFDALSCKPAKLAKSPE